MLLASSVDVTLFLFSRIIAISAVVIALALPFDDRRRSTIGGVVVDDVDTDRRSPNESV
jgi:hypothetical protein